VTSSRRRTRGTYRPRRSRSEVATAVAAVIGVLVVTAALIWFLRPGDSNSEAPSNPAPVTQPSPPPAPPESAPAPPESAPPQPGTP
jgi:hypothetical protein